jgi:hypothetical protein
MREQGLWDDKKEAEQQKIVSNINQLELTLQRGNIKLSEARELALDMRRARFDLRELITKKNELDANTSEGQAENARFNALVSRCLVYNETGEPVYQNVDDYLEHSTDEHAFIGAQALATMMFQLDKNHEAGLPENMFLKKWSFVDDELRLVNKDKHLVDTEGRLINADGHYVDKDGKLVDIEGRPVDDKGNFVVDSQPFLDDDGKPLSDPDKASPAKRTKKATTSKKQSDF